MLQLPEASAAALLFLGPRTRFAVYRLGPLLAHLRWLSGALGLTAPALLVRWHCRRRRVPVHWLRPPG